MLGLVPTAQHRVLYPHCQQPLQNEALQHDDQNVQVEERFMPTTAWDPHPDYVLLCLMPALFPPMSMCLPICDADLEITLGLPSCSILVSTLLFTSVSSSKVAAAGVSRSAQHVGLETQQLDIR